MLYPAAIFYSTFLDGTLLSTLIITWFLYEFWCLYKNNGSIVSLTISSILFFYTRTVFQWYFVPIICFALFLIKIPVKKILIFTITTILFIAPFLIKQYVMFNTLATTTFAGFHEMGLIWYTPGKDEFNRAMATIKTKYPEKADLYSGNDEFNNSKLWGGNLIAKTIVKNRIKNHPLESTKMIIKSIKWNLKKMLLPSSEHTKHALVDRLFWGKWYNFLLSGIPLLIITFSSLFIWISLGINEWQDMDSLRCKIGLIIPVIYIFLLLSLSNRYEWSEADRLKFFLEPLLYVFIINQFSSLYKFLKQRIKHGAIK